MKVFALRLAAFAIAVVAVADPAVSSSRDSNPIVAVVAGSPADSVLADAVIRQLSRQFTVVRGPFGGAAGTVLVGDFLPTVAGDWTGPVFAVVPARPPIRIVALDVPAVAPRDSRIPVDVRVEVNGASQRRLTVELRVRGLLVDRRTEDIPRDTANLAVRLHHVSSSTGPVDLEVSAAVVGSGHAITATALASVSDDRYSVLFFDARPSWMSTFVRRAIERDTRFTVTSRVQTSRGVSNTAGSPPPSLRDALELASFHTVVVGAPEALGEADVAGLDRFLRRRGGRVVLLLDRQAVGPISRLTSIRDWRSRRFAAPVSITVPGTSTSLRGRDLAWPALVPTGAFVYATSSGADSVHAPVVWSVSVGAGRLLVSGALDSWQFRDATSSAFDAFWADALADLSAGTPRPLEVELDHRSLRPGQETRVRVTVLDVALSGEGDSRSATVSAELSSDSGSTAIRLWPDAPPGRFAGSVVAPRKGSDYRLIVTSSTDRTDVPIRVDSSAAMPSTDERELLAAFVGSRGGGAIDQDDLGSLPERLSAAFRPMPRVETWHPMRSPWWIIPFALALGTEWWWRRRGGRA